MDSKFFSNTFFFFFFFVFYSCVFLGFCQAEGGGNGEEPAMQCIQKLLPCQSFLQDPSSPTTSCCVPLKQTIANETACLCKVITNPGILKNFEITEENAINLAKACGATTDTSLCNKSTSPSNPAGTTPDANSSTTDSSRKENAGHRLHNSEKFSFLLLFANFIFLMLSVQSKV